MTIRGNTRGCVMPIMYCRNKFMRLLVSVWLLWAVANQAFASQSTLWVSSKEDGIQFEMTDGSVYRLTLPDPVKGVFYDRNKHEVGGGTYVALFQVLPSNAVSSTGYCGAGSEVWLYVYKVVTAQLHEHSKVLVGSCLSSISMLSQNTGASTQETDFSSVQWTERGFSIEWFNHMDAQGRSLSSTRYVLQDGVFLPSHVVGNVHQAQ